MDSAAPRRVARQAEQSTALEWLARAGYAANGTVHILIGVITLVIAAGGQGESDQAGALNAIAGAPFGFVALWVLAIALWGLGLWHLFEGILVTAPAASPSDDAVETAKRHGSKWGRRVSEWGQALIFIALGLIAAAVALGARIDSEQSTEDISRGVLSIFGGPILLSLTGLGIGIGGVSFIVMGFLRSFEKKMSIPRTGIGPAVKALGIVGFIAKGIALVIVGILLIAAAITLDPGEAGGLDGAISALLELPYGPWLAGAVGVGLIAYGVFCFFRARFARL